MEIFVREVHDARIALGEGGDDVARVELAEERDRSWAPDGKRQRGAWKESAGTEREHGGGIGGNRDAARELGHQRNLQWAEDGGLRER
jgi:hypothetical protein